MKTLLLIALFFATSARGQTVPKSATVLQVISALCDTCKSKYLTSSTTGNGLLFTPKLTTPQWTFNTETGGVVARLSVKDSNGQQTGWFDKRYIKITSDSTFVILPKSK